MKRKLAFTSRASADIEKAYAWYESQRRGLGAEFQNELTRVLSVLESMPEAGPIVRKDLRRALVNRFPFALYYRLTDFAIEIRGCLHQHRDPSAWIRRA